MLNGSGGAVIVRVVYAEANGMEILAELMPVEVKEVSLSRCCFEL